MSTESTKINSAKRLKISPETRALYEARDKSLDNVDPECPVLRPEAWDGAMAGDYSFKKAKIDILIDEEILTWLESEAGEALSTYINRILRNHMLDRLEKHGP